MTSEKVKLNWSDYQGNVLRSFSKLHGDNLFADVTLVSEDNKHIKAHRLILSAGSKFFRNILVDKSHVHPMLCLDGVNSEELDMVIKYLYVGEVAVPQSNLQKFLQVAHKLKCLGLIEKKLEEHIKSENKKTHHQSVDNEISQYKQIEEINPDPKDRDLFLSEIEESEPAEILPKKLENSETEKDKSELSSVKSSIQFLEGRKNETKSAELNGGKKIKIPLPEFGRIEGQTFSFNQLKQFLVQIYQRTNDGFYSCKHCQQKTKLKNHMFEHAQKHIENLEFDCRECGQIFKGTSSLRSHILRKHSCDSIRIEK